MRLIFTIMSCAIVQINTSVASIGTATSGGGGVFHCPLDNSTDAESFVLDLWEVEHLPHLQKHVILDPVESVESQIQQALAKLKNFFPLYAEHAKEFLRNYFEKEENQFIVEAPVQIEPPQDARPVFSPIGCSLKGAMYFDSLSGLLAVDKVLYDSLANNTHKAAMWVHEAVYSALREYSEVKDSVAARRITGCLFTDDLCFDRKKNIEYLQRDLQQNGVTLFKCSGPGLEGFAYVENVKINVVEIEEPAPKLTLLLETYLLGLSESESAEGGFRSTEMAFPMLQVEGEFENQLGTRISTGRNDGYGPAIRFWDNSGIDQSAIFASHDNQTPLLALPANKYERVEFVYDVESDGLLIITTSDPYSEHVVHSCEPVKSN